MEQGLIPSAGAPAPAARRWRRLTRARLAEIERVVGPGRSAAGAQFWEERAGKLGARPPAPTGNDPFLARVRRACRAGHTVIDVGAGPGRLALALAPKVRSLTAVDISPAMLRLLLRRAHRQGLTNIATVAGRWEEVEVEPADVVVCVNVLPLVEEADRFLAKLDAACRGDVFLGLSAMAGDALLEPFWRHFHGAPRRPGPTYLDAVAILAELGIDADVEVVELKLRSDFTSVAAAARAYRELLLLPDTAEVRRELRRLLAGWLVPSGDRFRPPMRTSPAAIVHWRPARPGRKSPSRESGRGRRTTTIPSK